MPYTLYTILHYIPYTLCHIHYAIYNTAMEQWSNALLGPTLVLHPCTTACEEATRHWAVLCVVWCTGVSPNAQFAASPLCISGPAWAFDLVHKALFLDCCREHLDYFYTPLQLPSGPIY